MKEYILFISIRSKQHRAQAPHSGGWESAAGRVGARNQKQAIRLFQNTTLCRQFQNAHRGQALYLRCYQSPSIKLIGREKTLKSLPRC